MTDWPSDKVERWPVTKLLPYARNARLHSEDQVRGLANLISQYGWTVAITLDDIRHHHGVRRRQGNIPRRRHRLALGGQSTAQRGRRGRGAGARVSRSSSSAL